MLSYLCFTLDFFVTPLSTPFLVFKVIWHVTKPNLTSLLVLLNYNGIQERNIY